MRIAIRLLKIVDNSINLTDSSKKRTPIQNSNKQVAGLIPDLLINHMEKLRSQTLDLERRLEKEKKRLQRHTDDLKNYHHLQNSNNANSFPSKQQSHQQRAGVDDEDGESCSEQSLNNTQDSDFGGKEQQRLENEGSYSTEPLGSSTSRRKLSYLQPTTTLTTSDNKGRYDRSISLDDKDCGHITPYKTRPEGGSSSGVVGEDTCADVDSKTNRSRSKKKRITSQSNRSIAMTRRTSAKATTKQHQDSGSSGSCDSNNEFDENDNDDGDDNIVGIKEDDDLFKRPTSIPSNVVPSNTVSKSSTAATRRKMSHHDESTKTIAVGSITNADSQINNVKRTQSW